MSARKPKDLNRYVDAKVAADGLRRIADQMERNDEGVLIKWELSIRRWEPNQPHFLTATSVAGGSVSESNL